MYLNNDNYTKKMQILLLALFFSSLTFVLHSLGIETYLYWTYWWFDILTHVLGGLSIGFFLSLFLNKKVAFVTAIFIILGWESFEVLIVGIETTTNDYVFDTIFDLMLGTISAYSAIQISNR